MDYLVSHGIGTSAWPHVSCDFGQFDIAGFPAARVLVSGELATGSGKDGCQSPSMPEARGPPS